MFISPFHRGLGPFPGVFHAPYAVVDLMEYNTLGHAKVALYYDNSGAEVKIDPATETTLAALNAKVTACDTSSIGGTVAVSNMIPAVETGLATSAKQLADGHSVKIQEKVPTDATKNNPSSALTWTSGQLVTIVKTIGGVTYTKTLTWTSGQLTAMSVWS